MSTPHPEASHPGWSSFGRMRFEPSSGELEGPADTTRLAPQPARLLALLAEARGAVVTRDTIREHLWPGGKVEFEQGIAFAVREIRRAIEAVGGDPGVLETIPKRGFRLVVDTGAGAGGAGGPEPTHAGGAPRRRTPPDDGGGSATAVIGVALLAIAAVVFVLIPSGPDPTLPGIAFFEHASDGSSAATAVASAIGSELTGSLTGALEGRAGIVGPTGTRALGDPGDTESVRETLGSCLVVSGEVRTSAVDSLIVFTQIVRTLDRVHVWALVDTASVENAARRTVEAVTAGARTALTEC